MSAYVCADICVAFLEIPMPVLLLIAAIMLTMTTCFSADTSRELNNNDSACATMPFNTAAEVTGITIKEFKLRPRARFARTLRVTKRLNWLNTGAAKRTAPRPVCTTDCRCGCQ